MHPAGRIALALAVVFVLALSPACSGTTASNKGSSQSPVSAGSSAPQVSGALDPAVATPKGFPSDFPIYPGARLTVANQATLNAQTTWGMEWETVDNIAAVQAFYSSKLNQGDWTLSLNSSDFGGYSAIFTRKSNSKDAGLLTVEVESNVTHIRIGFGTMS
jgi:hypothetical protein